MITFPSFAPEQLRSLPDGVDFDALRALRPGAMLSDTTPVSVYPGSDGSLLHRATLGRRHPNHDPGDFRGRGDLDALPCVLTPVVSRSDEGGNGLTSECMWIGSVTQA